VVQNAARVADLLEHPFRCSECFASQQSDLGGCVNQLCLVICGEASAGGCHVSEIMSNAKLKHGGSTMKRMKVN